MWIEFGPQGNAGKSILDRKKTKPPQFWKYYDRARAGIAHHVIEALFGGYTGIEISAEHIPHYYVIVPLQELGLFGFEPPVGRPEKARLRE